jgi:hypothetical protein
MKRRKNEMHAERERDVSQIAQEKRQIEIRRRERR